MLWNEISGALIERESPDRTAVFISPLRFWRFISSTGGPFLFHRKSPPVRFPRPNAVLGRQSVGHCAKKPRGFWHCGAKLQAKKGS